MANVYYDGRRDKMVDFAFTTLPLNTLRPKFWDLTQQRLVPFLGAGASLPQPSDEQSQQPPKRPPQYLMDQVCAELAIVEPLAKRFVEVALELAQLVRDRPAAARQSERAPSSWELANDIASLLVLEPLSSIAETLKKVLKEQPPADDADYVRLVRAAADLMGLTTTVPQLLTVASYFNESAKRKEMFGKIVEIFDDVRNVTPIQRRIVDAATRFVEHRNTRQSTDTRDYVIITTNYDRLLEEELRSRNVPTCIVSVDMRTGDVLAEVMSHTRDVLGLSADGFRQLSDLYQYDDSPLVLAARSTDDRYPAPRRKTNRFTLEGKQHSLVMVYKIHGCPFIDRPVLESPDDKVRDRIVISDEDYVSFIQSNGQKNALVPSYIQTLIQESGFLFLGYSFSDWNVRTLYRNLAHQRIEAERAKEVVETGDHDYMVLRSYSRADQYFLQQLGVSVLVAELGELADKLGPPPIATKAA